MPIGEPAKPLSLSVDAKSVAGVLKAWADGYFEDRVRMALSNLGVDWSDGAGLFIVQESPLKGGVPKRIAEPSTLVAAIVDMITSGGVTVRVVPTPDAGKDLSP